MPSNPDHDPTSGLLATLKDTAEIGALLRVPREEQIARGYGHTLGEIAQQPAVWPAVAARMALGVRALEASLSGIEAVTLTGSGSSEFAAGCIAPALQRRLGLPTTAQSAGAILTHPEACLPASDASLLVSVARSGNSPESRAVVDWLLAVRPRVRHLFVTCNKDGALAASYEGVQSMVLPDETNDESLVMTSSFTSLILAGLALGVLDALDAYEARARALSRVAATVLVERSDALAAAARSAFGSALYLGSGCCIGAPREGALKMMEMNAGKVPTMAESFLGLRHGPMSAVHKDTLVVAFLSCDPVARAYELDLLRELRRKEIGGLRVVVGAGIPDEVDRGPDDVMVDVGTESGLGDDELAIVDVLVSQLLAFFRCLDAGFRPDSPSDDGIITRVVSDFQIHRREDL